MKKKNLFSLVFASVGMMLGFSSCKKCVECTTGSSSYSYKQILCKPQEFTNKAWNEYVDEFEDNGYDCDPVGM
jgi:hypothetical protein